jgi:hypothetical protein
VPGDGLGNIILSCIVFALAIVYVFAHVALLSAKIKRALSALFGGTEAQSTVDVTINQMYASERSERRTGSELRKATHGLKEGRHAGT